MSTKYLNGENIARKVYDPATEAIRTTSIATFAGGEVDINISDTTDSIKIGDGAGDYLAINPDGSINTNITGDVSIEISAADGDNIAISDGVNTLSVNPDGSINSNVSATDLDIRDLNSSQDSVTAVIASLPLPTGAATESKQDDQITLLDNIDDKLNLGSQLQTNSISVTLASDQPSIPVTVGNEPFKVSGTIDGTPGGTEYTFVNNIRQQVLASHDREEYYTYADFGTKNQRITRIDYVSPTFIGFIIRRDFNYVLDGSRYRRTDSIWTVV